VLPVFEDEVSVLDDVEGVVLVEVEVCEVVLVDVVPALSVESILGDIGMSNVPAEAI
jgi:hypothetical protein